MNKTKFDGLMVTLASMEEVAKRSHGVVDNPDTVNYRTGKPKQSGLFCESIFGPVKNFECSCGKYKGVRYKGIVCERCGVEVTSSRERRTRMGHVDLASPVVHVWYKNSPSGGIHQLLQLSANEIDKILTFVKYVVVKEVDEATKEELKSKIMSDFEATMQELETLYHENINDLLKEPSFAKDVKISKELLLKKEKFEKEIWDIDIALLPLQKQEAKEFDDIYNLLSSFVEKNDITSFKESEVFESIKKNRSKSVDVTDKQVEALKKYSAFKDVKIDIFSTLTSSVANLLIFYSINQDLFSEESIQNKVKDFILKNSESREKIMSLEQEKNKLQKNLNSLLAEVFLKSKQYEEIKRLYEENKASLENEVARIKSLIADLKFGATVLESDYRNIFSQFSKLVAFASGPEGILKMLQAIDVEKEIKRRVKEFPTIRSADQKKKTMSLIKLLINLYVSGVKPENMIIRKLPVIPPDIRPVVQLDGGRFASSDVNLFYRRVLMRNIRLKKMIQVGMPDIVKKNEIRLLQESINNLLVGEKNSAGKAGAGIKVFKSISDMLSGKEGVFRKNLLGKRVDYSGRSIITVGPDLKLSECGLPIYIAVKMFTPFIIGKLIEKKIVYTPKQAEKLIKEGNPMALKFLEEVIKDKYVLLNRAPTLHRLSIEAFKIKLMPGKTIRLHPLVCPAFNADFDGDQMAVHLPISDEAQKEARELIAADKNIIKPGSGEPTITHSQDMVLGIYFLTDFFNPQYPDYNTEEEWKEKILPVARFASCEDAIHAFNNKEVQLKDKIVVLHKNEVLETTMGRVIFNRILPADYPFVNRKLWNKDLKRLLSEIFDRYDMETTVQVADAIKDYGFKYSTHAATSINILDMKVPKEKEELLRAGDVEANEVLKYFYKGFFSEDEKHRLIVKIWTAVKKNVETNLKSIIGAGNNLYTMIDSGARGSQTHLTQISGMKGLVVNPKGEIIELPIKSSFVEGLKPIEYFISAHSGRKGKADTALRTAESGYLTRKLCDASQEMIIREEDCGSTESILYSKEEAEIKGEKFWTLIYGRILAEDAIDANGVVVLKSGELISKSALSLLETSNITMVRVRSPLTCHCVSGVCQKCYGMDLATRNLVEVGVPVGVIAAQSIGEPSTQLTLDTFHEGGVAGSSEASGIDRVKQLFEVRAPKNPAIVSPFDGTISFEETPEGGKFGKIKITSDMQKKTYLVKSDYKLAVKEGAELAKGAVYASRGASKLKTKEAGKVLEVNEDYIVLGVQETYTKSLVGLAPKKTKVGERVYKGEILTTGALDVMEYKKIVGDIQAQRYIISESKKVYAAQGQDLNDKHIEVVVKQLFSKVFIEDGGDSSFIPGTYVKYEEYIKVNAELQEQGKRPAQGQRVALGLTTVAKETDSWMSAASFQETIRVMVGASLRGAIDHLSDLKANVIIGRLLPVGENYRNMHGY